MRPPSPDHDEAPSHRLARVSLRAEHRCTDWTTGETTARELDHHVNNPDKKTRNLAIRTEQRAVLERHAALPNTMSPVVTPAWKPSLASSP